MIGEVEEDKMINASMRSEKMNRIKFIELNLINRKYYSVFEIIPLYICFSDLFN